MRAVVFNKQRRAVSQCLLVLKKSISIESYLSVYFYLSLFGLIFEESVT